MKNKKNLFWAKLISILFVVPNAFVGLYCFYLSANEKPSVLLNNLKNLFENSYFQKVMIIIYFLIWLFSLYYLRNVTKKERKSAQINSNSVEGYYREIPCNSDLERAYWVLHHYTDLDEKTLKTGIIGAFILKWIKEKKVFILDDNNSTYTFRDDNYKIDLSTGDFEKTQSEQALYNIFKKVAGSNNILEKQEFLQWQKSNGKELKEWYKNLIDFETSKLENSRLLTRDGILFNTDEMRANPKLLKEANELLMLKNFLLDYSLIKEREHIEVALWEYYLIFAELLGIADKVDEQFKNLVPNYSVMSKIIIGISYNNLLNTITNVYIDKILVTVISSALFIFVLFIMFDIVVIKTLLQSI